MTEPKAQPRVVEEMVVGRRYLVEYQLHGMRIPRMMLAELIEVNQQPGHTTLIFSGRPQFGTVTLDKKVIRAVSLHTVPDRPNFADKKVR